MIAKLIADKDCYGMVTELKRLSASSRTKVSFVPTAIDPAQKNLVLGIDYEDWRRHKKERHDEEGSRLTMSLQKSGIFGTDILKNLAKLELDPRFRQYGWIEPIQVNPAKPEIVVNFSENKIKEDPTYLDHFFTTVENLLEGAQKFSDEFIYQIKTVIAHTCFEKFQSTIEDLGFNRGFKEATALLLPTALHGVDSPYILAAEYCAKQERILEARSLLTLISPQHWQYPAAVKQQSELYELELDQLRAEIRHLRLELLNLGVAENIPHRENVKAVANTHAKPALLTGFKRSCEKSQASRFTEDVKTAYFADPKPSKWII
jgi:hypothetical protein